MRNRKIALITGLSGPLAIAPVALADHDKEGVIPIHNYQVVVEAELEPVPAVFSVTLPPNVTSMTVPPELLALSEEFKYEVLAREESWNQTAVESCFKLAG